MSGAFNLIMILTLAVVVILSFSCSTLNPPGRMNSQNSTAIERDYKPQILSAIFVINSKDSVRLQSIMLNQGELRKGEPGAIQSKKGDLALSVVDENFNTCTRTIISNPLERVVEFSDDYVTLQSKLVKTDSATFYLRVQYTDNMKYIIIEKLNENPLSPSRLFTTRLKLNGNE